MGQPQEGNRRNRKARRAAAINPQAEDLLIDLFRFFGRLYGDSAAKLGVGLYDANGELSADFRRWCRYLAPIPIKHIRQGCERVQERYAIDADNKLLIAPPSCADFLKIATADWRSAAHNPFEPIPEISAEERERARIASRAALSEIQSLLGKK